MHFSWLGSLRKTIVLHSKLRNHYNKPRTSENLNSYRKQWNLCVQFLKSAEKDYYNNLNTNLITDNKRFWKTVKPAFWDKTLQSKKIVLVDNDGIISNDADIAETFNKFFVTIAEEKLLENHLRSRVYLTLFFQQSISSLITLAL